MAADKVREKGRNNGEPEIHEDPDATEGRKERKEVSSGDEKETTTPRLAASAKSAPARLSPTPDKHRFACDRHFAGSII